MNTRTSTVETKYIEGVNVTPQVGSIVKLDGKLCEVLRAGDDFCDSGYPGCDFRLPVWANFGAKIISSVAVNVKVTGRTIRYRDIEKWVSCRIEFVGDCESSTFAYGYLKVS